MSSTPTTAKEAEAGITVDSETLSQGSHGAKAAEAEAVVEDHDWQVSRRRIVRKLDLYLLPFVSPPSASSRWAAANRQMVITYGLQYLDKAVLGFAAAYSLRTDNVRPPPPGRDERRGAAAADRVV